MKTIFKKVLFSSVIFILLNNYELNAQSTTTGNTYASGRFLGWGTTSGNVEFRVNNTVKMLLQNTTGNLGIGTTSPEGLFHVEKATSAHGLARLGTNGNIQFILEDLDQADATGPYKYIQNSSGVLYFGSATRSAGLPSVYTDQLAILNSGNVGIGTNTPSGNLTVMGASNPRIELKSLNSQQGLQISRATCNGCYSPSATINDGVIRNLEGDLIFDYGATGTFIGVGDFVRFWGDTRKVQIGNVATPGGYKLYVEQGILTEKVKIALKNSADWSDYVFADEYDLMHLEQVEKFVKTNKHLPNIPSAEEVVKEGIDMAKMDAKLLEKIEELTLYIIDMNKMIQSQSQKIVELQRAQSVK